MDSWLVVVIVIIAWVLGLFAGNNALERKLEKDEKYLGQTRIDKKVYRIELIKEDE